MKSELNVGYIIRFFRVFVKLKMRAGFGAGYEQDFQDLQDFTGLGLWCAGAVVAGHGMFDVSASIIVVTRDKRDDQENLKKDNQENLIVLIGVTVLTGVTL